MAAIMLPVKLRILKSQRVNSGIENPIIAIKGINLLSIEIRKDLFKINRPIPTIINAGLKINKTAGGRAKNTIPQDSYQGMNLHETV